MRTDLLLKLADFLEKVPQKQFRMSTWGIKCAKEFQGDFSCGFAGCAIGWGIHAGLLPGLKHVPFKHGNEDDRNLTVCSEKETDFDAVASVLDLSSRTTYNLFDPDSYHTENEYGEEEHYNPSPHEVATRIRDLIEAQPTTKEHNTNVK